jgi:HD-GYP domain-containing protein (c-di-GMP phosphodiesterase class II)
MDNFWALSYNSKAMIVHRIDQKLLGKAKKDGYHRSGKLLFEAGEHLTVMALQFLKDCRIQTVYELEEGEKPEDIRRIGMRKKLDLSTIEINNKELAIALYNRDHQLIARPGLLISKRFIDTLMQQYGDDIFFVPRHCEDDGKEAALFRKKMKAWSKRGFEKISNINGIIKSIETYEPSEVRISTLNLERSYDNIVPDAPAFKTFLNQHPDTSIDFVYGLRQSNLEETETFFKDVRLRKPLNSANVYRIVETILSSFLASYDASSIAASCQQQSKLENYLGEHSLNMAMLSGVIAIELNYSTRQVTEVMLSAFLANVGSFYLNQELFQKKELSRSELFEMQKVPIYGIDILQKITGLPRVLPIVAYQFRERLDGSGYPRKRQGHVIHPYSKIVSVADVYDAMLTPKPWRKALIPYQAMEELIHLSSKGKFDKSCIKAFLHGLSLFPVGSLLELEGKRFGYVVAASREHFDRPLVQVIYENDCSLSDPYDVNLAQEGKIIRAVDPLDFPEIPPLTAATLP